MKLLQLDYKQLRIDQKRLRTRINKIRSYLRPDEIVQLRALELEGKLERLCHSVQVSSSIQIAAAAKRLKLGSGMRRPKTAPHPAVGKAGYLKTPSTPTLVRTHSTPRATSRPDSSVSFRIAEPEVVRQTPSSRHSQRQGAQRPLTSVGPDRNRSKRPERSSRPKTAPGADIYSSHNLERNEFGFAAPGRRSSQCDMIGNVLNFRKSSSMSMDSVEMTIALARKQEARQGLIETEQRVGCVLDTQRRRFIDRVKQFVDDTNKYAKEEQVLDIQDLETGTTDAEKKKNDVCTSTRSLRAPPTPGGRKTQRSPFHF